MRGRKPKPTTQKLRDGNPGKRPVNRHEPQPPTSEADTFDQPPPELAGHLIAIAEWTRLAPMLRKCRQITDADRSALIAVCLEWARYLEATRQVAALGLMVKSPNGYPIMNPYLPIMTRALGACTRLWPELGLTPSSRSRVSTDGPGPGGDVFSEFDQPPSWNDPPTKH